MLSEDTTILKIQYQKSDKASLMTDADLECSIEKTDEYKNNSENWSTAKEGEHIPSGFSMYTIKHCMKKICEFIRMHAMKIINFKKKKNEAINKGVARSYENAKICYICKEKLENK